MSMADQTWNTCPDCGHRWKDDVATPQVLHRTRLCEKCALPPVGFVQAYTPNWQDKIAHRLFPSRHCEMPSWSGKPFPCDGLHVAITIELSFMDRVRFLFTGRAAVSSKTITENLIGKHATNSTISVLPWKFLERK